MDDARAGLADLERELSLASARAAEGQALSAVKALYSWQATKGELRSSTAIRTFTNMAMFKPKAPMAGPTGGAGVASARSRQGQCITCLAWTKAALFSCSVAAQTPGFRATSSSCVRDVNFANTRTVA